MNWEQALELVNEKAFAQINRRLSDVENAILRGAWQGQTYKQIADFSGYSANYFKRDVGPKLWKLLSQVLGETVSKTNFRAALERQWIKGQEEIELVNPPLISLCSHLPLSKHNDWGEVVDVSSFYGHSSELTTLEQWIQTDCCHLIAILGMGGVGKTALAAKLVRRIESKFEAVIWRSLRHVTRSATSSKDILSLLSHQQNSQLKLGKLMKWLQTSRCLIILDSIETILQPGSMSKYLPGYEDYGEFFRLVGETVHQSYLILTSREKTVEIAELEGMELGVRSLQLKGSLETAQALIQAKGLSGSAAQQKHLCELYNCNPLLLKIVANSIQELFDGKIAKFLAQNTPKENLDKVGQTSLL